MLVAVAFAASSGAHCGEQDADIVALVHRLVFAADRGVHCGKGRVDALKVESE